MTRRISLIVGVAVLALFVVPAALGAGRYPDSQQRPDFWNYESNAKVADSSPGVAPQDLARLFAGYGRGLGTNYAVVDALGANSGSPEVSTVDSSTEIESRVGIGLGIGILLVLGLGLAMRIAHVRPFAH